MNSNFLTAYDEGYYKAKVKITQDLYVKLFRLAIEKQDSSRLPADLRNLFSVHEQIEQLEESKDAEQAKIWMLTINPPDGYTWKDLIPVITKVLLFKNCIIDPQVQLEQRSMDVEFPEGYHAHIACKLGKSSKNVIDDVFRVLSKQLPKCTRNCIDLRRSPEAYMYVSGNKVSLEKREKVEVDKLLRNIFFEDNIKPEWLTKMDYSQGTQELDGKDPV